MSATSAGPTDSPTEPAGSVLADRTGLATLMVVATSLMMGTVPLFARELTDAGLSPVAISFYRNLLGAIVLAGLLRFDRDRRSATMWALAAGLGMGLGWVAYVRALAVVPVSTAGLIYMSYPLFAIVIAWVIFRQAPALRALLAGFVVLAASLIALGSEIGGDIEVLVVAFAAPVSFGFAIAVLTERLAVLRPIERVAPIALGSTLGLAPLMLTQPAAEAIPDRLSTWLLVLGIAIVTAIGPQWLYSTAAPHVGAARAAVAGSVELPMMFVVGYLWFEETLTAAQGVAGLMVLGAILLVPSRPSPTLTLVRRRRRLKPGAFYRT